MYICLIWTACQCYDWPLSHYQLWDYHFHLLPLFHKNKYGIKQGIFLLCNDHNFSFQCPEMKCSVKNVFHKYYICNLSFNSECRLSCFQGGLLSKRWYNYTSYKMDATWSIFGWYFYNKNWCLVITYFVLYISVTFLFSQSDTVLDVRRACLSAGHLAFCYGKWCH